MRILGVPEESFIDENVGKYVAFTDYMRGIQVAGILRSRKRFLHPQECYIQVIHCIDINNDTFIDDLDEYILGVEDDFVCKIKDMRFYSGEQNYRDRNVKWMKVKEKSSA